MSHKLKKILTVVYLSLIMSAMLTPSVAFADEFWDDQNAIDQINDQTAVTEDDTAVLKDENSETNAASGDQSNTEAVGDTGDAIKDIMDNDRFKGAISSISWLTDITDRYFAMAITLVAFFIISAALLKNACAGAYCANSKFWDKVHESHQKNMAYTIGTLKGVFSKGGMENISPAGIRDFLLGLLPDIKAFTEFEDADIDPKQYFMKAIPQMLLCVIIGVFIYNGYYRDTASVVGSFGAETFERVMASADPVGLADRLYNSTGTPKVASDYDNSPTGEVTNEITHDLYKAVMSQYTDINGKAAKSTLINNCEGTAKEVVAAISAYVGTEDGASYKNSVSVKPTATMIEDTDKVFDNGHTYVHCVDIYDAYDLAEYSNKDEQHYAIIAVESTRIVKGSNGSQGGAGNAVGVGSITYYLNTDQCDVSNGNATTKVDIPFTIDGATRYNKVTNKIDASTQSGGATLRSGVKLPVTTQVSDGSYSANVTFKYDGNKSGPSTTLAALRDAYKQKNGLNNQ